MSREGGERGDLNFCIDFIEKLNFRMKVHRKMGSKVESLTFKKEKHFTVCSMKKNVILKESRIPLVIHEIKESSNFILRTLSEHHLGNNKYPPILIQLPKIISNKARMSPEIIEPSTENK